jgi:hypothetical protein
MAKTVAGIKIKTKKPRKDPLFHDEKHIGSEPVWDTDRALNLDPAAFDSHLRKSFRYYNYFYTQKELKKLVVEWLQKNAKLTKPQLAAYIQSSPDQTPMTLCSLVKAISKGMPQRDREKNYILGKVMEIVNKGVAEEKAVKKAGPKLKKGQSIYTPTIQDRLAEKTAAVIGELEGEVDNVFQGKPTTIVVYDFLTAKGVAQAQVGKIREVFLKQIGEVTNAFKGKDEQLKEAYSHLKKADVKRIGEWYIKLLADLDSYVSVKKAAKKQKAPRAVSKDKIVAKVKYLKESKELKLVSVNPVDIIGAAVVWIYHTKYRKLGRYVADSHGGTLSVKGTSIIGYDAAKSTAKTLRKPAEQLAEFMKAGKVALRTHLQNIKAVETKLNGRMSADILILKVE